MWEDITIKTDGFIYLTITAYPPTETQGTRVRGTIHFRILKWVPYMLWVKRNRRDTWVKTGIFNLQSLS